MGPDYNLLHYAVSANPDGSTLYIIENGQETLRFAGIISDTLAGRDKYVAVVQLTDPTNPARGMFNGPTIDSTSSEHYSKLRSAVESRPGGAEDWQKLGVDTILATGSSMNASNTPSIAAANERAADTNDATAHIEKVEPSEQEASAPQHADEQSTGPQGTVEGQLGASGTSDASGGVDTSAGGAAPVDVGSQTVRVQTYGTITQVPEVAHVVVTPTHLSTFDRVVDNIEKDFGTGYHFAIDELIALRKEMFCR